MKVVGLVSGGKDSCHNLLHCLAMGHEIVAIANLKPREKIDELDSYMYQTVGHEGVDLLADAMELPLYRREIRGSSISTDKVYEETDDDEVEDLLQLLLAVLREHPDVKGVSVGAILSDYQRVRVENVCSRLKLTPLAYLWQRSQDTLLQEMIATGLVPLVIKTAAMGLAPRKHCSKSLGALQPLLLRLHNEFDLHVCGEGGEYETFVVDGPLCYKRIVIDESETVMHSDDAFAPVGYLRIKAAHLEAKSSDHADTQEQDSPFPPRTTHSDRVMWARRLLANAGFVFDDEEDIEGKKEQNEKGDADGCCVGDNEEASEGPRAYESHGETRKVAKAFTDDKDARNDCSNDADDDDGDDGRCCRCFPSRSSSHPGSPWLGIMVQGCATCSREESDGDASELGNDGNPFQEATEAALGKLKRILVNTHHGCMTDIKHVNLIVGDMASFAAINAVYIRAFGTNPPSRVCVEETLPAGVLVMVEAICFSSLHVKHHQLEVSSLETQTRPQQKKLLARAQTASSAAKHMHVQGISHWAPSNIGPYSQAVQIDGVLLTAGQIALIPGSMCMKSTSLSDEMKLSFRHVRHLFQANGLSLANALNGVCYVDDEANAQMARDTLKTELRRVICSGPDEAFSFFKHQGCAFDATTAGDSLVESLVEAILASTIVVPVPVLPRQAQVEWHVLGCFATTLGQSTFARTFTAEELCPQLHSGTESAHGSKARFDVRASVTVAENNIVSLVATCETFGEAGDGEQCYCTITRHIFDWAATASLDLLSAHKSNKDIHDDDDDDDEDDDENAREKSLSATTHELHWMIVRVFTPISCPIRSMAGEEALRKATMTQSSRGTRASPSAAPETSVCVSINQTTSPSQFAIHALGSYTASAVRTSS